MMVTHQYFNRIDKIQQFILQLQFVLFGFTNNLASHLERSPIGYASAGGRPTWLLVSSMRLTPNGAYAINLSRRFIASLPLKSKSFMQYASWSRRQIRKFLPVNVWKFLV
jgi:hypothetical protein